jgi:hypothetical protein
MRNKHDHETKVLFVTQNTEQTCNERVVHDLHQIDLALQKLELLLRPQFPSRNRLQSNNHHRHTVTRLKHHRKRSRPENIEDLVVPHLRQRWTMSSSSSPNIAGQESAARLNSGGGVAPASCGTKEVAGQPPGYDYRAML